MANKNQYKVGINYNGVEGVISYTEDSQEIEIEFPDEIISNKIIEYFNTSQVYRIPQSSDIDDFIEVYALPLSQLDYFEMALCTLYSTLGVYVNWKK